MNMKRHSPQEIEKELLTITSQLLAEAGEPYRREIRLDANLQRHLNIDSLGRAELFQRIEKSFNVSLPDRLLTQVETLQDIADYLQQTSETSEDLKIIEHPKVLVTHEESVHLDLAHAKTLIDIILAYGETFPDKAHIYFQKEDRKEEIITYGQLLQSSLQIASALRALGLKEGETVAIMQPTHPGFFYTFYGTLLAGGIPVPIYPPFRMHLLEAYAKTEARILRNAEVRILVTFEQAENLSHLLQAFVPSLKHVTTVSELLSPNVSLSTQVVRPTFHAKSDHFAFIQYTSGSTADPKGVLLTHYNLLSNIRAYGNAISVRPDDVAVSWLPLYHDMGLIGMWLGSLYYGVPLILMTPFSFLNHPERWLWAIHYHRGTVSGAPNFAYELCVRKVEPEMIEGLDLSSWRVAANGAEKIYPRTLEKFAEKFSRYGFSRKALLPVYGLAESTVALTIPKINQEFHIDNVNRKLFEEEGIAEPSREKNPLQFVSCGKPIVHHEVRICADDQRVLPERHVGNLQFRGPSSMQGYYNNPEATLAIYHDGWFDSGDLGYLAQGEVFITGRRKDLIIKAGRNIYPAEIEELIGGVIGIRQGCVIAFGVSNIENTTEQLVIVAETREKNAKKLAEIHDQVKETIALALDIVPDIVILVEPHIVPKTSSGKLQRSACKKMYLDGRLGKKQIPAGLQIIKLFVQGIMRKSISLLITLGKLIYTLYIAMVCVLSLIPLYFIVLLANENLASRACQIWAKLILSLAFCPLKVIDKENLTKRDPVIYAMNHASYIDSVVALATLPIKTRFVGKKELFTAPFLRTFVRKLGALSVDRLDLSKGIEDTKRLEEALKKGESLLIFPEGTFGYASGLRPFRLGAFKIAIETKVSICPIALQGTRQVLRDDEKLLRPNVIHMTVCKPIEPQGMEWQDVTNLRNIVRAEIAKYCGEPSLDFIAAETVAQKPPSP